MKKITAILSAMLILVACGDDKFSVETPSDDLQEIGGLKVDINITRNDFASTKAYIKSSFATNDVVFIFFSGVASPKYLEAKHTGSNTWTFTAQNGLTSADLEDAVTKKMTAIYLPYGSDFVVSDNGYGDFLLMNGGGYTGYFLTSEKVDYSITSGIISGTITLSAPELETGEKYVHFDVQGFSEGTHFLHQEYVRPVFFNYIAPDGTVTWEELPEGESIEGYRDGENMSFSGALISSAVGNAKDYQFTINNNSTKTLYTRDAGTKTLSTSKYIGLGDISTSTWNTMEYVDMGLPSGTLWAKCNLGASTETGYGDYYAWGEITPYYEVGYALENPLTHWKSGKDAGYAWGSYRFNPLGDGSTFSKYTGSDYSVLQSEDDAATANLKGVWRMPTKAEFEELCSIDNCTWDWQVDYNSTGINGYLVTSISNSATIFLPAAGNIIDEDHLSVGTHGLYWLSSLYTSYPSTAYDMVIYLPASLYESGRDTGSTSRKYGETVRPVFVLP